jgi:hypothetical protein
MLSDAQLKALAHDVMEKHKPMMSLYQVMADYFYPERADFTVTRNIGTELADFLVESLPIMVRRDLGDSLSAMLRDGEWFEIGSNGNADQMGGMWLEWATNRMSELFNDRNSNFTRATKEGDHDFVTFGQCVISCEVNKYASGLLFRCWHLRDVSWWDDESGQVCGVVRKWKPTYADMMKYFGEDNVHANIKKAKGKDTLKLGDVRHIIMPSDMYEDEEIESKFPYVSIFMDIQNDMKLEVKGINNKMYIVPRFKTIPGSPFAFSPATTTALPDARSIQQIQHTILEAAERYTRPPIIATQKVIRGDVDLSADGITWVDDEYDEKMGAALRPLTQNASGFPIGLEMKQAQIDTLKSAFYSNKLAILNDNKQRTAYEASQIVQQYRRENLPLFAPIESEYSAQLCELAFDIAFSAGFLGSPQDVPESLMGHDVTFKFKSPLIISEEEKKVTQFHEVIQMATEAVTIDKNAGANIDMDEALRDAVSGSGAPETWKRTEDHVLEIRKIDAMQQTSMAAAQNGAAPGKPQGQPPQQGANGQ